MGVGVGGAGCEGVVGAVVVVAVAIGVGVAVVGHWGGGEVGGWFCVHGVHGAPWQTFHHIAP